MKAAYDVVNIFIYTCIIVILLFPLSFVVFVSVFCLLLLVLLTNNKGFLKEDNFHAVNTKQGKWIKDLLID